MTEHGLGRRVPQDFSHVDKHPFLLAAAVPITVETMLSLPRYRTFYDQGNDGSCTGFSASWALSIIHRQKFYALWLYKQAQLVDEFPDTPPAEGSTVRASFDVLRTQGPMRVFRSADVGPVASEELAANTWATTIDEMRAALGSGVPTVWGISWHSSFDTPVKVHGEWWIGVDAAGKPLADLGPVRGGHAICQFGASDKRQAGRWVNSWGAGWPPVFVPYVVLERLLAEDGECCVPVLKTV